MRKRIKQLARGKFDYTGPQLVLSEEQIKIAVTEDSIYEGEFTITSENQKKIRGIVYSTSPRMEVLTSHFEGEEVRIRYKFNSKGMSEGLTEAGEFVIVCNQNEISLSFVASISKEYAQSTLGTIKNLYDFSCLARSNWEEAYQLFYHKSFINIIKPNEIKERMMYAGILEAKPSNMHMEEFLIGIRKKDRITLTLDNQEFRFDGVEESIQEIVEIKKSDWGYVEITASCEEDFIQIDKARITSADFIGSVYPFGFIIDPDKMHKGVNYGRIRLASAYETLDICVTARKEPQNKNIEEPSVEMQKKECQLGIMELYQAYRLKRIVTGVWANETIDILNHLHALEPDEPMHLLMKAQCLIINRQRQEAQWILDDFRRECTDRKSPEWGYYLYIMTLIEREPSYVDRLTKEIEAIFRENPDNVMLFWVLTFLQDKYFSNNSLKLKSIEYWVNKGNTSPYLYLEAYYLIWQDPYLLAKMGTFEKRVLRWAVKRRAITKDIAGQIFQIAENTRGYDPSLYDFLCAAYEASPKEEYVGIICAYLIKGQKYDKKYHHWFEKGISLELRITGLYEAYLISMDERKIEPVPKIIRMYFQYDCNLPYKKIAVLYNNIIASKNSDMDTYLQYRKIMSRFAMEQVEAGHMDDNLAVLYEDMLDLGLVNKEIANALADTLFTRKIIVFDPKIVKVVVYQKQMKQPQVVTLTDNTAYFNLYSEDYVLLFEDAYGRRYCSASYQLQNLMDVQKYLAKCMSFAPERVPYLLYYFDKKMNYLTFTQQDKEYLKTVMTSDEVHPSYKAKLLPEILRFYQMNAYDADVENYLLNADYNYLDESTRKFVIELLVEHHLHEVACDQLYDYGIDQLGSAGKVSLATYLIDKLEGREDEFLVDLAAAAFFKKKYNDKILKYLCDYYSGPTSRMLSLWNAANVYEIECFELSERLLVQMLYADNLVLEGEEVFAYYYDKGGKDFVTLAYISDCAHKYFVENKQIHEDIFRVIEARMLYDMELNDACKLALLRYYSQQEYLGNRQLAMEEELLAEFTRRNMHFAFYKKLHPDLVLKYHLYDKVFLEHRTNPHSHVILSYSRDEDGDIFIKEDMSDVYDGIFVKAFTMFFGEAIQYYISEEHNGQVQVSESNRIMNQDVYNREDESRFHRLNQMLISASLQEEDALKRQMKDYAAQSEMTSKIFKLL